MFDEGFAVTYANDRRVVVWGLIPVLALPAVNRLVDAPVEELVVVYGIQNALRARGAHRYGLAPTLAICHLDEVRGWTDEVEAEVADLDPVTRWAHGTMTGISSMALAHSMATGEDREMLARTYNRIRGGIDDIASQYPRDIADLARCVTMACALFPGRSPDGEVFTGDAVAVWTELALHWDEIVGLMGEVAGEVTAERKTECVERLKALLAVVTAKMKETRSKLAHATSVMQLTRSAFDRYVEVRTGGVSAMATPVDISNGHSAIPIVEVPLEHRLAEVRRHLQEMRWLLDDLDVSLEGLR